MGNAPKQCTIYLVRHGRTDWNKKHQITGISDIPLNPEGVLQAKELGNSLKNIHFDAVFSSDLIRARQTAEILALEHQLAVVTTASLKERNFGTLESESTEKLQKLIESYKKLSDTEINAHKVDKDYESNDQLIARVMTFLREIAIAYAGKTVLAVAHGSLLRTLLIHLGYVTHQNAPFRIIHNAGYLKLQSDGVDFKILEVNPGYVIS